MRVTIWQAYLYAVTFLSLLVAFVGAVDVCAVLLQVFVYPPPVPYPQPPSYYSGLPRSVAMLLIGLAVWAYHWQMLRRDEREQKKEDELSEELPDTRRPQDP